MRRFKVLFIFIFLTIFPFIVFAQDNDDENKYGKQMYTTPEVESPETYNPWSSYKGLVSDKMLKKIQKLNRRNLKRKELENREQPELKEAVKLPELSKLFGQNVALKYGEKFENALSENVSMEKLAEAIVKNLMELKRERELRGARGKSEKGTESAAVEGAQGEQTPKKPKNSEKKSTPTETVEQYEKDVKLQESTVTLTYLIFGKKVVIKSPQILADNFREKEKRLKKEIELMATLLNERGKK